MPLFDMRHALSWILLLAFPFYGKAAESSEIRLNNILLMFAFPFNARAVESPDVQLK
ncbi:uncharacterized protein METZ01_LOCUS310071, partial [marine metagenome]